jgi:hypothetical protein
MGQAIPSEMLRIMLMLSCPPKLRKALIKNLAVSTLDQKEMVLQENWATSGHIMYQCREELEAWAIYLGFVQNMKEAQFTEEDSTRLIYRLMNTISMAVEEIMGANVLSNAEAEKQTSSTKKTDMDMRHELIWLMHLAAIILNHMLSLQLEIKGKKLFLVKLADELIKQVKGAAETAGIQYKKIREVLRVRKYIIDDQKAHHTRESARWKRDLQNIRQLSSSIRYYESPENNMRDLLEYSREYNAGDISGIGLVVRVMKVSLTARSNTLTEKPLQRIDAPSPLSLQSGAKKINYTRLELIREIHHMPVQLSYKPHNEHFGASQAKIVNKCAHMLYDLQNLQDEVKELLHQIALIFLCHLKRSIQIKIYTLRHCCTLQSRYTIPHTTLQGCHLLVLII